MDGIIAYMVRIHWPLPHMRDINDFEVVGRYVAQTVLMERFIDLILLKSGWTAQQLFPRMSLAEKIDNVAKEIARHDVLLRLWSDVPEKMRKVKDHRNRFAHRLFERGALPSHLGPHVEYARLSRSDLEDQEREAYVATELCRQLASWILYAELNPGLEPERREPEWPATPEFIR